jgi:hypothetical protein
LWSSHDHNNREKWAVPYDRAPMSRRTKILAAVVAALSAAAATYLAVKQAGERARRERANEPPPSPDG